MHFIRSSTFHAAGRDSDRERCIAEAADRAIAGARVQSDSEYVVRQVAQRLQELGYRAWRTDDGTILMCDGRVWES